MPCDGRFQLVSENGQTVFPDAFGGYQSFYFVRGAGQCCLSWNFDFDLVRFIDGGPETTVQPPFNTSFCLVANTSPNQMDVVIVAVSRVPDGFPPPLVLDIGDQDSLRAMAQPVDVNGIPTGGPRQDLRDLGFHPEFYLEGRGSELDPTRLPDGTADSLQPGQDIIRASVTPPPVISEGDPVPDFSFWPGGVLGFSILSFLARGLPPAILAGGLPVIVNPLPTAITVTPVVAYEDPSGALHEVSTIERAEPFETPQNSTNNPLDPKKYVLAVKVVVPSSVTQDQTLTLKVDHVEMLPPRPLANIPNTQFGDGRDVQQDAALFFSGNLARPNQQGTVPITANPKPAANQLLKVANLELWPNNKEVQSGGAFTMLVPPGKAVANRDVQLSITLSISGSNATVTLSRSQLLLTVSNEETFEEYLRVFYQATDVLNGSGSDAFFRGFDAGFYNALKSNGATAGVLNSQGTQLWDHAWQNAQTLNDDRPLYWARLRAIAALRAFGKRLPTPITGQALRQLIKQFEFPSRGLDPITGGISFVTAPPSARKAIVTGFDPFALSAEPRQSNPSGLVALNFNGRSFGSTQAPVYVRAAIFPVRYNDFDENLVENAVEASIGSIVMLMTCSQGRSFYDVERFAGKNRGRQSITDNNGLYNPGKVVTDPANSTQLTGLTDPLGRTLGGPEFIESKLPYTRVITSVITTRTGPPFSAATPFILNQAYWVLGAAQTPLAGKYHPKPTDPTLQETWDKLPDIPNGISKEGSGSNFLSNEIFYRTAFVRSTKRSDLASGHLHIPPVGIDPRTLGPGLLNAVETALTRFLEDRFRMRSQGDVTFPKTAVGRTSAPLGLTAVNETNETITIGTVEISPPQSFALQTPSPIPPVAAGATLMLQFTFNPQAVSVQTSNVTVHAASGEILFTAKLTGEGTLLPPAPQITSFDPISGVEGDTVTIFGANLDGATAVRIGSVATTFTPVDATQIIADVTGPPRTAQIAVDTPSGTALSAGSFRVIRPRLPPDF